jgi:signal transduction histidine kinase
VHSRTAMGDRVLLVTSATSDNGRPGDPRSLIRLLEGQGCTVEVVPTEHGAIEAVRRTAHLCVLVHVRGPEGLGLLRTLRGVRPEARLAVLCDVPDLGIAIAALRLGTFDYLAGPLDPQAVEALVHRARGSGDLRLRAYTQSLQALTPGLVHELRNPLSGILASGQMLGRVVGDNPRAQEYIRILRDEALQLERFLARLAEFGRLPKGGIFFADPVDLTGFLTGVLEEWRPRCMAHRIGQVAQFDSGISGIRAEPTRLALALGEILANAVEAMPSGGTLTVTTRRVPGGVTAGDAATTGWADILVADTGGGMAAEVHHRAFEPFFSTRPRALGIGLALAQAILVAHGGSIHLDSRPGTGTQVLLRLLLAPAGENGH